jgi:hypothetical protein
MDALRQTAVTRVRLLTQAMIQHGGRGTPVYAFVTSPRDVHAAVLSARACWISDTSSVSSLPAAIAARSSHVHSMTEAREPEEIAKRQLDEAIAAIERERPAVIIADNGSDKLWRDYGSLRRSIHVEFLNYVTAGRISALRWSD